MAAWGGPGVAELTKEIFDQVKKLKKPMIKGGAVDGVVVGPAQVEAITKLPSREALIGRVVALAMAPAQRVVSLANAPGSNLAGQIATLAEPKDKAPEADAEVGAETETPAEPEAGAPAS